MRKLTTLIVFLLAFGDLSATHIVGGEMTYTCLGNDQYEVNLTIFRDCFNGDPGAFFDDPAPIGVFNGATNGFLFTELIPFDPMINDTLNPVLSGECAVAPPDVCVHTTTYTTIMTLPSTPGGYYLTYQRCCRNVTISNIVDPLGTGATFGVFISENALNECNSTPQFNSWPPVYICVNEPISFDQSAVDVDGDSIVYKLCTPLLGAAPGNPAPNPPSAPPYTPVTWIDPPYNESNMLNGSPGGVPLTIDIQTGLLEGLPNTVGQFVVGICVEEYRDGVLISTTRRDFQYNVGVCGQTVAAFAVPEVECGGLTVNFMNESLNGDTFEWYFGDPANPGPNSTLENPTYTYPAIGTYTVTLIADPNTVCADTFSTELELLVDSIVGIDLTTCSGEPFNLEYEYSGDINEVSVTWTDSSGDPIASDGVVVEHTDCAPGVYEFIVTATCIDDPAQSVSDIVEVTVITDDISPFITIIEEPCFVDVVVDSACAEFITVIGDIPVISPGDVGSVTVEIMQTTKMSCSFLEVTLNYNCACSIGDLVITPEACNDGFFMVSLDFEFENTTGEFQVTDQDGADLGTFNYDDLPVMVGPFLGDPDLSYSLNVMDLGLTDCASSQDFETLECVVECTAGTEGPICDGGVLSLFETGVDAVAWEWFSDGSAIITSVNDQNPTATNVSDGEIFSVIVTAASGLSDTCFTVATVFELPACNLVLDSAICEGGTLQLMENGGEALSWFWSSDGAAMISDINAQNPSATNVTDGEVFTVEVTDANGCTSTCSATASVNPTPACNADTDGPICAGGILQLLETGGDAISWAWSSDGAAVISDVNAQNPTATGVVNGEVFQVDIVDANGCISSCTVDAIVNDLPICNAETAGAICDGGILELNETGGEAISWAWSTDGGAVISDVNAQNPTASDVTDGETFTVEIVDANGCISTCEVTAVVNPLPNCNAGNDGPICAEGTLQLVENGGDAISWSWSSDGSAMIDDVNAQNPTATNVSDGETFTVEITDANGCVSSCSVVAQVFDPPVCSASNDGPICAGDPLTLFEEGGEAVSWAWSSDGAATIDQSTDQNPIATNVTSGEIFTVEITDANGCISSCSTTAEVYDTPDLQASNNGPVCEGDIIILEAEINGGNGPYSYQWSHSNGFNSTNATVYIQNTTQDDAGLYMVEIVDGNGCEAMATTEVDMSQNVNDPGQIGEDEYFCGPGYDPANIFEIAPPSGAPGVIEFFWMKREAGGTWEIIPGATGSTYDPGPIYVTTEYSRCVRIEGCISALESNVVTKFVGNDAMATIVGPGAVCLGIEEMYFVVPTPNATYEWDFGPNATASSTDEFYASVVFNSVGLQHISITVTSPTCVATNYMDVIATNSQTYCSSAGPDTQAGDQGIFNTTKMTVYPNPFEEQVTLRLNYPVAFDSKIQVTDLNGRLVKVLDVAAGNFIIEMDLADLASGVYFINLEQPGQRSYHQKVVKR